MEFNELNDKDKKDVLDLMHLLSTANLNIDDDPCNIPKRTEMEILDELSDDAAKHWRDFLLSRLDKV